MKLSLIALAAGLVACPSLPAASVIFSAPVTLADDGNNVNNAGTILTAVNFVSSVTQTNPTWRVTLNDIAFVPVAQAANANRTYFTTNSASVWDTDRGSGRPSSAAIYPLIYNAAITSSDSTPFNLTLRNLTIGTAYRMQFILSSNNSDSTDRSLFIYTPTLDTSYTVYYGVLSGPQILTANFVADSTTQIFTLNGDSNGRPSLSGFVLAAVPEPATFALLGLAAVALGAAPLRRKLRQRNTP